MVVVVDETAGVYLFLPGLASAVLAFLDGSPAFAAVHEMDDDQNSHTGSLPPARKS